MPKKTPKKAPDVQRPLRDPDHFSKRGVPYWWAPEWVRATSSSQSSFGSIKPVLVKDKSGKPVTVEIYMRSKEGKLSYIQGSIQQEFKSWHEDRQIDYILLGETPEDALELIVNDVEDNK
jgi:hypothetical protein